MTVFQRQPLLVPVQYGVPRTKAVDSTLGLLFEGYPFIWRRCTELGTDIFFTRLMGRPVICASGAEAARMFWQPGRFTRRGALLPGSLRLLQGSGSSLALDGEDHRHRRAMLMSLQTVDDRARKVALAEAEWRLHAARLPDRRRVPLFAEAESVLCAAACRWAGVPAGAGSLARLAESLSAALGGGGNALRRSLHGLLLRRRIEAWARELVAAVRAGGLAPPSESPLAVIARHRDRDEQAVGARVCEAFDWRGLQFEEGTWVLFDLYGTNHDPALWPQPGRFRPERFAGRHGDGFDLVAQGAGDYLTGHRCPAEALTLDLVKSALHLLASEVEYAVPRQDLSVDLSPMPALPASGLLIDVALPVR